MLERGTSTWTLYVDKATPTLSNNTAAPGTPGAGFSIGAQSDGTRAFVGDVDEVSVYTTNIGATATAHYDAGRRPTSDAATALTTRTGYDGLGRAVDVWSPATATLAYSVVAPSRMHAVLDRLGNQLETWANDQTGAATTATGDVNIKSTFAYDVAGELIGYCPARQLYTPGCTVTTATEPNAWHYVYDAMGRQTKTLPPVNVTNTALTTTEQVYDTGGHLTSTCHYPAGTACASVNSRHVDFVYDAVGRVLTEKTYDRTSGSDTLKFTKTLTWNADGTQGSVAEGSQTFNWVYDAAGRLSQLKDGSTVKTAYTYTPLIGTVATRTDGTMGTTTFGYDWANRETLVTPPSTYTTSTVTRTYRLDGTLATRAFSGSVTETLSYDAAKRPTQISMNTSGTASTLQQAYDRGARVATEGRSLTGISGDPGTGTQTFSYDGSSRVTGSTGLSKTYAYAYDLDGNRLTRTDGSTTTTFTTDFTDELTGQTIGGTNKNYTYDSFGNLTGAADASSNTVAYTYDEASRLTGITPQTGSAATLTVDALDRAKTRTVAGSTDTYGYIGTSKTTYETGAATTDALLDLDGSRLAVKTGGTLSWVIFDLHGSIVALCPAGGTTLSDAYRYDPWGQAMTSGTTTNPWRYRGLLDVSPNGTSYLMMGARYYVPSLASFSQADTAPGKAANPASMNRYLYAEADPATLIDPDGRATIGGTLCSPGADYCTQGGNLTVNRTSTDYRAAASTCTTCAKESKQSTTVHFVAGVPISSTGLLVRPDDYEHLQSQCLAYSPNPMFSGSVCDAWYQTQQARFDATQRGKSADSVFLSTVALDALNETLDAAAKKAGIVSGLFVAGGSVTLNFGTSEVGAEVVVSGAFRLDIGGILARGGRVAGVVGAAIEFLSDRQDRLDKDATLKLDPWTAELRADAQAGSSTAAGFAAGAAAFSLCEGSTLAIGTPGCIVLGVGVGLSTSWAVDQVFNGVYDSMNPRPQ